MADFASEYGIRLATVLDSMSWREFRLLLTGLLSSDTRLTRHFTTKPTAGEGVPDGG